MASKSVRVRSLLARVLSRPGYAGVLAFTAPEAVWLTKGETSDDIVVGYPSINRAALSRIRTELQLAERIALMVDDIAQVDLLSSLIADPVAPTRICLDIDASWRPARGIHIGARRSPLHSAAQVAGVAAAIANRDDVVLVGLMSYDAQVAGVGDAGHGPRALAVRRMQAASLAALNEQRRDCVDAVSDVLATAGRPPLEFVQRQRRRFVAYFAPRRQPHRVGGGLRTAGTATLRRLSRLPTRARSVVRAAGGAPSIAGSGDGPGGWLLGLRSAGIRSTTDSPGTAAGAELRDN